MPKQYTVQDSRTGKTITFEWSGAGEPTDADMEQVFSAASAQEPPKHPYAQLTDAVLSKEFGGNLLKSAGNAIKGIGDFAVGAMGLQTGQYNPQAQALTETAANPGQLVEGMKNRYGSKEAVRNTLYTDPVGAALDASAVVSAGAGAARGISNLATRGGRGLMRSALQVPEKVIATSPYVADDMTLAQTALDQGISRSTGGRQKLDNVIAPLGTDKGQLMRSSPLDYNPHDPATTPRLRQQIQTSTQADTVAPEFPGAAQNVLNTFTEGTKHNRPYTPIQQVSARTIHAGPQAMMPETQVPIAQAAADKVRIGQGLSDSAWATNPADQIPRATADAQRALYGDLAAQEGRVPGVADLNAQLDPLYSLREHLVNSLGAPQGRVPYPSQGGFFQTIGNTVLPYAESLGARGLYQTGQGLAPLGQMADNTGLVLGGANAMGGAAQSDLPSPPPPADFQGIINAGDPIAQTFGPQPQGPEDNWWSPRPRLRP